MSKREKECGQKQKHPSRKKAKNHLWSLVRGRGVQPNRMAIYQCAHCGFWHVGHKKRS